MVSTGRPLPVNLAVGGGWGGSLSATPLAQKTLFPARAIDFEASSRVGSCRNAYEVVGLFRAFGICYRPATAVVDRTGNYSSVLLNCTALVLEVSMLSQLNVY